MALEKITPTHQAIATINQTIKTLKLQRDALAATLPEQPKQKQNKTFKHPLSGKIFTIGRR